MNNVLHRSRALVSLVLAVVIAFSCATVSFAAEENGHTLVTTAPLNLRSSASSSSYVLKVIPKASVVTLLEDSAGVWTHISYDGCTGYSSSVYLNAAQGSDVEMIGTTTAELNIRSGKGTSYSVKAVIPEKTSVTVTDNSDEDWAYVEYKNYTGYVSKDYLTVSFAVPEVITPVDNTHRSASFTGLPVKNTAIDRDAPTRLLLSSSSIKINVGGSYAITAMDAASRPITAGLEFTSSDKGVATVSASGVVAGKMAGGCVITVKDTSTGRKASCEVKVSSDGSNIDPPTEAPTQAPTAAPTAAPTQAPTVAPTEPPTQAPTQAPTNPPGAVLKLSATSATVYKGCLYQLTANLTDVSWSSSNSSIATVSSDGIVTALANGAVDITAKTSASSAVCKLTVISGTSVSLSHSSATVTAGKTFLARCYTSGVQWSSSSPDVASVNNGYILAKSAGKTVVTVASSKGAATMLVTVTEAAPIRFAYTSPNCAAKNETVTLIAITDQIREGVRFKLTVNGSTVYIDATSKTKDGNTMVWKGTTSFSSAGTYKVNAYSKLNGKWTTCDDGATTAFVSNTSDMITTVCTERRASDGVIALIANFEGYISSIYDDPITGDPTVGYGRVIFSGQQFYNTMTKNEAFAYLVQTVNNDGYATKVNQLLINNNVKFNQQQFDALVCLVYNTGAGVLTGDTQLQQALLDCHDGSGGTVTYYINASAVRIRKGPGTGYDIIKELDYNTVLTVLSTSNSSWYQVKLSDGTTGYVSSDYISKRATGGNLDLNYVDRQNLIDKFCQYHHAGGSCVYGLLYRRVDEMEMFFYGDYDRNYGIYKYDIKFKCANNESFHT